MVKIEKYIEYYNKGKISKSEKVEIIQAATEEIAKEIIKNYVLHYVKNPRGLSMFEKLKFMTGSKSDYKIYSKQLNYDTCEEWGNF